MIEKIRESDYCSALIIGSFSSMILLFLAAIILGPNYCHDINLFALLLTLIALIIFVRNFNEYNIFKKILLITSLIINLTLGILLMIFKYGYFGWHYVNLFRLEV